MAASVTKPDFDSIEETAHLWRARLAESVINADERAAFDAWLKEDPLHAFAYEEAKQVWQDMEGLNRTYFHERLLRQRFIERLRRRSVAIGAFGAIAASIALALAIPAPQQSTPPEIAEVKLKTQTFSTILGELRSHILSDGSTITLGGDSAVEVAFTADMRRVDLARGEAFFDVATDQSRPFIVSAGAADVQVTGTQFDVQLGKNFVRARVAEGSVRFSYPLLQGDDAANLGETANFLRRRKQLVAGQQIAANVTTGDSAVRSVNPETIGAWRQAKLAYSGAALSEVIADVNRYSDTPIVIADPALEDILVTATFDADSINTMLDTLSDVFAIRVTTDSSGKTSLSALSEN
ncbi:MAG: FecR domain-containing protein [Pseudomonadota bacterium]